MDKDTLARMREPLEDCWCILPVHAYREPGTADSFETAKDHKGSMSMNAQQPPPSAQPSTSTQTTTDTPSSATDNEEPPVLRLRLVPRPQVRWDSSVLDNEGMNRKSSKRCCIFHKQRDFGESSTDSDEDDDRAKPIARPKPKKKNQDFQRYHA